jgi:hypothetical protein
MCSVFTCEQAHQAAGFPSLHKKGFSRHDLHRPQLSGQAEAAVQPPSRPGPFPDAAPQISQKKPTSGAPKSLASCCASMTDLMLRSVNFSNTAWTLRVVLLRPASARCAAGARGVLKRCSMVAGWICCDCWSLFDDLDRWATADFLQYRYFTLFGLLCAGAIAAHFRHYARGSNNLPKRSQNLDQTGAASLQEPGPACIWLLWGFYTQCCVLPPVCSHYVTGSSSDAARAWPIVGHLRWKSCMRSITLKSDAVCDGTTATNLLIACCSKPATGFCSSAITCMCCAK